MILIISILGYASLAGLLMALEGPKKERFHSFGLGLVLHLMIALFVTFLMLRF